MTAKQYLENLPVSSKTAWGIVIFLVSAAITSVLYLGSMKQELLSKIGDINTATATTSNTVARLGGEVEAIRTYQAASTQRADSRQDELRERIDNTARDLDTRIRPLENQTAVNNAKLEAILVKLEELGEKIDGTSSSQRR